MMKVTCGIPVYNGANRLKLALESLIHQTYPSIKFVISDDGSSDNSRQIIKSFANQYPGRFDVTEQSRNLGMWGNFRFVLQQSQTPYFYWASQDDLWEPTYVQELVSALEKYPEAMGAFSGNVHVESDGRLIEPPFLPPGTPSGESRLLDGRLLRHGFFNGRTRINNAVYYGLWQTSKLKNIIEYQDKMGFHTNEKGPVMLGMVSGPFVGINKVLFRKLHGLRRNNAWNQNNEVVIRENLSQFIKEQVLMQIRQARMIAYFPGGSLGRKMPFFLNQPYLFLRKTFIRLFRALVQ